MKRLCIGLIFFGSVLFGPVLLGPGVLGSVYAMTDKQAAARAMGLFEEHQDVGVNPKSGMTLFDPGPRTYTMTGGGANIWGMADAFQFVYTKLSGDVTFSADVRLVGAGTELHRKAALMIRQSLQPDSAYADAAVHGDGLTALQYRPGEGVETAEFRAAMRSPTHLSITRHGHEFTISASQAGGQPAMTGPVVVSMQDPVFLGLAVCSHNADVLETAVFSNVRITKGSGR